MTLVLTVILMNVTVYAKGNEVNARFLQSTGYVYLNDNAIDGESITYKSTTYLPVRKVSEAMGLKVEFDKNTNVINLTKGGEVVITSSNDKKQVYEKYDVLTLNSVSLYVDGDLIDSDNILYNGTTYLPIRAISEAIGVEINYDSTTQIVYLTTIEATEVLNSTNLKPMMKIEDITFPKNPTTVEDFEKVILYMMNNDLQSFNIKYSMSKSEFTKQSEQISDNIYIAFENLRSDYIDLCSGLQTFATQLQSINGALVLKIQFGGIEYEGENFISLQKSFEEEAYKVNESLKENGTITVEMTETEIARALYTYVTTNLEYDMETYDGNNADNLSFTGYGAVMNGRAVCQGYTAFYNYLLKLNGIECIGQSGTTTSGVGHIWTVAMLDGKKTYIDTTFGDPVPDKVGYTDYKYFGASKSFLSKDRTGVK